MNLGLDLASSKAKVARARQHLDVLDRELPVALRERGPYSVRFSEVDPQTGWCEVWLVPASREDRTFNMLFGDFVHNLRCALDYIVTGLVGASGASLGTNHQFPIYREQSTYTNSVGSIGSPLPKGPLGGLTHGVGLIESWQPYKLQLKGSDPRTDPLWHVHRFSNADKHREVATFRPVPVGSIDLRYKGFKVEDQPVLEFPPDWSPDEEYVIHRMRFDPPIATDLRVVGDLKVGIGFSVPPFGSEPFHSVSMPEIKAACDHVAMLVDLFETI